MIWYGMARYSIVWYDEDPDEDPNKEFPNDPDEDTDENPDGGLRLNLS